MNQLELTVEQIIQNDKYKQIFLNFKTSIHKTIQDTLGINAKKYSETDTLILETRAMYKAISDCQQTKNLSENDKNRLVEYFYPELEQLNNIKI